MDTGLQRRKEPVALRRISMVQRKPKDPCEEAKKHVRKLDESKLTQFDKSLHDFGDELAKALRIRKGIRLIDNFLRRWQK